MDDKGNIYGPEEIANMSASEQDQLIPISRDDEGRVIRMNRHERRKWSRDQRRAAKK